MHPQVASAHDLAARLVALAIPAVAGAGVRWQVDVGPVAGRSVCVYCFWNEPTSPGTMVLGMNPGNARSAFGPVFQRSEGIEYKVILWTDDSRTADGRTASVDQVVAGIQAWIAGASLSELAVVAPFIDEKRRAMAALAARLDARLRWDIGGDPSYPLWIYGAGRSCEVIDRSCAFRVGQAQVAFAEDLPDTPGVVASWLLDRCSPAALAEHGVALERHADVIEVDPARWHWLHLLDRMADPDDVLAELAPLIAKLSERPLVTRFYPFSSLDRLCFSASSHYPWVEGFRPTVAPVEEEGMVTVDDVLCDWDEAVRRIEAALAASPVQPFFGSAPDHELPSVVEAFARSGSKLVPRVVQRQGDMTIEVEHAARNCRFEHGSFMGLEEWTVGCFEGSADWHGRTRTVDDAAALARRFLEERASFEVLSADTRVCHSR